MGDSAYAGTGAFANEYESVNESCYFTIDKTGQRDTLSKLRKLHGLDDAQGKTNADVVTAAYINGFDLGLGRRMSCLKVSDHYENAFPCVVDNYIVGNDPRHPTKPALFASVAMERILAGSSAQEYTAFLVFDANGSRINSVDVDGFGEKRVPEVCWACHDGEIKADGSHNGQYLSFDTELYKDFPGEPTVGEQQENFRQLNDIIYAVAEREKSVPVDNDSHKNIQRLIKRWYNDKRPEFALPGDIDFSRTVEINFGHEKRAEFYGKYCRTCHVSQTGAYGETNPANSALFNCQICHSNTAGGDTPPANLGRVLCDASGAPGVQMPNALVAHSRLAEENLYINRVVLLGSLLDSLNNSIEYYTPCAGFGPVFVQPPRNDPFENAIELSAGISGGTLVAASSDGASFAGALNPDVWYKYTATQNGLHLFNTCGSHDGALNDIDTALSVHSSGPGTVENTMAFNDEYRSLYPTQVGGHQACKEPGINDHDSALEIELRAGQEVLVSVSVTSKSYNVGGNFQLQLVAPPEQDIFCIPIKSGNENYSLICL